MADGSVRSQNLRQAAAELLGLEGTPWELVALTFHPQDEMVSIRSAADPSQILLTLPPVSAAGGRLRRNILLASSGQQEKILSLSVILFHLGPMRCSGRDWTWTGQGEQTILSRSSPMMTTAPPVPHCGGGRPGHRRGADLGTPSTGHPRLLPASFTPRGGSPSSWSLRTATPLRRSQLFRAGRGGGGADRAGPAGHLGGQRRRPRPRTAR